MKNVLNHLQKNKMKMIVILSFLLICSFSFSATSGAKYFASFITVLEDFFSDTKKVVVAVVVLGIAIFAIRAIASQNFITFIETIINSTWIVAIIGVITTIVVAVGGATIEKEYIIENKKIDKIIVANIEIYQNKK